MLEKIDTMTSDHSENCHIYDSLLLILNFERSIKMWNSQVIVKFLPTFINTFALAVVYS